MTDDELLDIDRAAYRDAAPEEAHIAGLRAVAERAAQEEREACAKAVDALGERVHHSERAPYTACAASIRARVVAQ